MNLSPQLVNEAAVSPAVALTAFVDFLKWTMAYGHEIRESRQTVERGISISRYPVVLELSVSLSASVNFGYDPNDQAIFIALESEEFKWLPNLPIEEVVIGRNEIYVLIAPMEFDGESFDPMAIAVATSQPKMWRAFPNATHISFMCITAHGAGMEVTEFGDFRYPLRYLND